ncbi:hypothetical protein DUI87_22889 [Hirundo rustica rustica]|uniref:Uncharacterized protein n=1 Tax=Hirundo rustica rustica TaxID=333673 RepID=A0A3M0JGT8_HIRRU|nr:hypothetical protein DUI87_22889 [Hirundo rustica rustica]
MEFDPKSIMVGSNIWNRRLVEEGSSIMDVKKRNKMLCCVTEQIEVTQDLNVGECKDRLQRIDVCCVDRSDRGDRVDRVIEA